MTKNIFPQNIDFSIFFSPGFGLIVFTLGISMFVAMVFIIVRVFAFVQDFFIENHCAQFGKAFLSSLYPLRKQSDQLHCFSTFTVDKYLRNPTSYNNSRKKDTPQSLN
jgi:hypothetical protein